MRTLLALLLPLLALCAENPVRTIVDILSGSPEFSEILNLLQHRNLITLLNQSRNATFLAPVNSAFIGVDKESITREQLLYHIINATATSNDFTYPHVYSTYLDHGKAPIALSLSSGVNGQTSFVDVDMLASPNRGVVHSVSQIVPIPSSLNQKIYTSRHLRTFSSLLNVDLSGALVLCPRSDVMSDWLAESTDENSVPVVLNYLSSPFGEVERKDVLYRHIVPDFTQINDLPRRVRLRDGVEVTLHRNYSVSGPGFDVDAASSLRVGRNGVYVELDGVLADDARSFLELSEEKFILGLGGHALVRTLHLYGHQNLIDGHSHDEQVIVVPVTENTLLPATAPGDNTLGWYSYRDSSASEQTTVVKRSVEKSAVDPSAVALYQFLERALPKKKRHALLDTKMYLRSGKHPQRVHFARSRSGKLSLNWEYLDATHYTLGNTTFYVSHDLLPAPSSLTLVLGPLLTSSYSLQFLEDLNMLQLPTGDSWTLLIPAREAWERNLLLMRYLDENKNALKEVFANLVLTTPIYSDSGAVRAAQYRGVETAVLFDSKRGVLMLENELLNSSLTVDVSDVLFDNGVVHVVNTVPLPRTLEVSARDLIASAKRTHFLDLLHAAGMDDVLDPHANYTVLVPPSRDLRKSNYTTDTDPQILRRMLALHLLPGNPVDRLFEGATLETLAGESMEVQEIDGESNLFGLSPSSAQHGQRVLLYEYGYTNGEISSGSTVVLLDRHISPRWIVPDHFGPKGGTYAIIGLLFGVVLACAIILGMVWLITSPSKAPLFTGGDYHDNPESNIQDPDRAAPLQTPAVSEERRNGRHLNLPT